VFSAIEQPQGFKIAEKSENWVCREQLISSCPKFNNSVAQQLGECEIFLRSGETLTTPC